MRVGYALDIRALLIKVDQVEDYLQHCKAMQEDLGILDDSVVANVFA